MSTLMEYKGFKARIMEAERLIGDYSHTLPPGRALEIYPMDSFLKIPENWMRGSGVFIVPVKPNKGLWFDWTMNSLINTAIIPTIKGCNPITGLQTSGFYMERYENKCPKHGCNFLAERFCPECNYKWPDRNYVSSSGSGYLWIDGFRAEDGTVRQFFFSEDELRDIATHLIGKENTVPAFGFAFFSPKEQRPEIAPQRVFTSSFDPTVIYGSDMHQFPLNGSWQQAKFSSGSNSANIGNSTFGLTLEANALNMLNGETHVYCCSATPTASGPICSGFDSISVEAEQKTKASIKTKSLRSKGVMRGISKQSVDSDVYKGIELESVQKKEVKEVSIGAGAKINQKLNQDIYPLDSWKEAPDSVMTIYFVFQEKFEELKAGGLRNLEGSPEGILTGLPVG